MKADLMQEIFEGRVRSLSSKGMGVVEHPSGIIFFVRGAFPTELVKIQITQIEKRYGFAKLLEILEPSSERRSPPCPHHGLELGQCSGCPWMPLNYEAQLKYKEHRLLYTLKRSNIDLSKTQVHQIIPSDKELGYRNRAQLKSDGNRIGYLSEGSKVLAPITDCLAMTDKTRATLKELIATLPNDAWKPTPRFLWSFLEMDEWIKAAEISPNKRRPFFQGNSEQNTKMRSWLKDQAAKLSKEATVIELFSGSGNFTEILSKNGFKRIIATEIQGEGVHNLQNKNLPNVETHAVDLFEKGVWWEIEKICPEAEILVMDPPRDGLLMRQGLFKGMHKLNTLIYISCDVDTFVRDVKDFTEHGWHLTELQALDQFPQTPHVEILSVLTR